MRLVANKQTTGDYGTIPPGGVFHTPDDIGRQLIAMEIARIDAPPAVLYETKVVTPEAPQVSTRDAFPGPTSDGALPDAPPQGVAAESDPVLPETDIPEPGAPDSGRRSKRSGSGSK